METCNRLWVMLASGRHPSSLFRDLGWADLVMKVDIELHKHHMCAWEKQHLLPDRLLSYIWSLLSRSLEEMWIGKVEYNRSDPNCMQQTQVPFSRQPCECGIDAPWHRDELLHRRFVPHCVIKMLSYDVMVAKIPAPLRVLLFQMARKSLNFLFFVVLFSCLKKTSIFNVIKLF